MTENTKSSCQAARRPHMLHSTCGHSFGALAKPAWLFIASLHSQTKDSQLCPVDIFVDLQLGRGGEKFGSAIGLFYARPWIPIDSPLTHIVYLLSFQGYLAGSKSVSALPPDNDNYHCRAEGRKRGNYNYRSIIYYFVERQKRYGLRSKCENIKV